MKSFAKIRMDSLKEYQQSVEDVSNYTSSSNDCNDVFVELKKAINEEIRILQEKTNDLEESKSVLENKIEECQEEIDETQSEIDSKEEELNDVQEELDNTDEYYSYEDENGDCHDVINPYYVSLEQQEAEINEELTSLYATMNFLLGRLSRCNNLLRVLVDFISEIVRRVGDLLHYLSLVERYEVQYEHSTEELRKNSEKAVKHMIAIERTLTDYMEAKIRIASASTVVKEKFGTSALNNIEYLTPVFQEHEKGVLYDDDGQTYKNANGLIPNGSFHFNGYTCLTDNLGRPITMMGKIHFAQVKRERKWDSSIEEMGRGDERIGDDRGHAIAHRFDGPDSLANAFPQDGKINKGEYKAFEDYLENELNSGKDIVVIVTPIYKGENRRPTGVSVCYTINGISKMRFFKN